MLRFFALVFLALLVVPLVGCANIVRGTYQQIHIGAYDTRTDELVAADCRLSNDEGTVRTKSNRTVKVGRDKDSLRVDCSTDDLAGQTVVDGRVNMGFLAVNFFLIDGCIISCFVDGLSGAWAEYPASIDVPLDPR